MHTYQTVVLKRRLLIIYEAARTGSTVTDVINQQNASGGMWAFGEGLEGLYLVVTFYMIWPVCFNLIARLPKLWAHFKKNESIGREETN